MVERLEPSLRLGDRSSIFQASPGLRLRAHKVLRQLIGVEWDFGTLMGTGLLAVVTCHGGIEKMWDTLVSELGCPFLCHCGAAT